MSSPCNQDCLWRTAVNDARGRTVKYINAAPRLSQGTASMSAPAWISLGHGDEPLAHTYPASNGWLLVLARSRRVDAKSAICAL
jgi:hypothetical protein